MRAVLLIGLLTLLSLAGCKKDEAAGTGTSKSTAPLAQLVPGSDGMIHGKVLERIDAPNYTYLRVGTDSAEVWTAVPTTTVAVGTEVAVTNPSPMPGFESKTLNRKWDMIYFGGGISVGGAPVAAGPAAPMAPTAPMGMGTGTDMAPIPTSPPVDLANIKVDKATGPDAKTVAEVWTQKTALKDKSVTVRAKVVKYTSGVLGKNWLHLRDGTGGDATKDNDITVVTSDVAAVNDVVTVQGQVHLDRDLGSGYAYPVLIEDAKVSK